MADAVVVPPIASPATLPDARESAPAASPGLAAHLLNERSPDLLLEPPEGLAPRGERIIDSAPGWGLVAASLEGVGEVVVLDRLDAEEQYVIEAILVLPPAAPAARVAWDDCHVEDAPDDRVVAIVTRGEECTWQEGKVEKAWRAMPEGRRFVAIDPQWVRCPAPFCPEGDTNAITAPGP